MYEAVVEIPAEIAADPKQLETLKQAAQVLTFGHYRIARADHRLFFGFATLLNARLFRRRLDAIGETRD